MRKQMRIDERLVDIEAQLNVMQGLLNLQAAPAKQSEHVSAEPADEKKATAGKTYKTVSLEY